MKLTCSKQFDVLVAGSGIAGLSAAREAAVSGCSTAILSSGPLFSGSSFYLGTWGFGLVGPAEEADVSDVEETILSVGCGMADPALVRKFVSGINPAITRLEAMGCRPKKAGKRSEREYIPCFDHKHRNWNGLEADDLRKNFFRELKEHKVTALEHCTLLELVKEKGKVCGAVVAEGQEIRYIGCRALILATGGYGTLFSRHLCTEDVSGLGQFLALKAGASLVNMEFMQMMAGYLYPAANTIFNEKTFRFANFSVNGKPLFDEADKELLDLRSTYGPFTSRLPSKVIDRKIHEASLNNPDGVEVSYADAAKNNPPEFIRLYFDWLAEKKGIRVSDTIHIGIFSHAANGGIRIDAEGRTGVDGLFACGEATGGMHGADRIGGLSTANGLVFGQRAGKAAAEEAKRALEKELESGVFEDSGKERQRGVSARREIAFSPVLFSDRAHKKDVLQKLMYEHALIVRKEEGLLKTKEELCRILSEGCKEGTFACGKDDGKENVSCAGVSDITDSCLLEGQLMTALAVVEAALLRRESRGSHFRSDFPRQDSGLARPIEIRLKERPTAEWSSF